jgi:transcriptional antiterminator RfaH
MKTDKLVHDHGTGWHVLYTYANFERKVQEVLQSKKIEVYLPLVKTEKKWSDRKKVLEKPLFPNYLFIRPENGKFNYSSLTVKGAVRFVKTDGRPCLVRDNEIVLIQKLISITGDITQENSYKKGDQVQVLDGPFEGLCGTVRELSGMNKLYVHLELLNQTISVKISNAQTRKLSDYHLS